MKNNPNKKTVPRYRAGQLVTAPINNAGDRVLCQVRNLQWANAKKTWVYICVTKNGHHVSAPEGEVESAGPKPVSDGLLHVVHLQENALTAAIITALDEALAEHDAGDLVLTMNGCTYKGITRDEDGDLQTMFDGTLPLKLSKAGTAVLVNLYHAYVRQSLLPL